MGSPAVSWLDLPEGMKDLPDSGVEWVCEQMGVRLVDEERLGAMKKLRDDTKIWCKKCSKRRVKVSTEVFSCPECGETEFGCVVGEYRATIVPMRSEHSRSRWMRWRLAGVVEGRFVDLILDDFSSVLRVMISKELIKGRNLSGYGYYIIRLCSRRGIKLLSDPGDLKKGKTRDGFDNNLFGVVYSELGWDNTQDKYYTEWRVCS